ncbi:hypothetical protein MTO96_015555 [Rhipicephalus appendiculatus]
MSAGAGANLVGKWALMRGATSPDARAKDDAEAPAPPGDKQPRRRRRRTEVRRKNRSAAQSGLRPDHGFNARRRCRHRTPRLPSSRRARICRCKRYPPLKANAEEYKEPYI